MTAKSGLLEERARERGINLEEIGRTAEKHANELLHSTTLKVFRYVSKSTRKPHLYVEFSDHGRFEFRRKSIAR